MALYYTPLNMLQASICNRAKNSFLYVDQRGSEAYLLTCLTDVGVSSPDHEAFMA